MPDQEVDTVRVWELVSPEERGEFVRIAAEQGVQLEEVDDGGPRELAPVAVIMIVVGASAAVSIALLLLNELRGGTYIDLRPGADPVVRRSRDLAFGQIVTILADGSGTKTEIAKPDGPLKESLTILSQVITGTVEKVLAVAKDLPVDKLIEFLRGLLGNGGTTQPIDPANLPR